MELRIYGVTELWKLRQDNETLATPDYKTTSQRDNESGGSLNYGITDLRNYGITEALPIQRVVRSLPIANSQRPTDLSIHYITKYYYITTLQLQLQL